MRSNRNDGDRKDGWWNLDLALGIISVGLDLTGKLINTFFEKMI